MTEHVTDAVERRPPGRQREVQRVSPPGGTSALYANSVMFRTSFWDIAMDFGMIVEADEEKLVIHDLATVTMSPQHAKVFSEVLAKNIKLYEEQFGPIPSPPDDEAKPQS